MSLLETMRRVGIQALWLTALLTSTAAILAAQIEDTVPPVSQVWIEDVGGGFFSGTQITVKWSGTDVGSGIRDFTIYVDLSSSWLNDMYKWEENTTAKERTYYFPFPAGRACFYSVARDFAGNVEPSPWDSEKPYNPQGCVDFHVPQPVSSHVLPLPAIMPVPNAPDYLGDFAFKVQWSYGSLFDMTKIALYVSDNGSPFTLYTEPRLLDGAFECSGLYGHTYGFFTIAKNDLGDEEPMKTAAEATTKLAYPGDVNADGTFSCADIYLVKASLGKRYGQPGYDLRGDVVFDGIVDIRDLSFVARKLPTGTVCP